MPCAALTVPWAWPNGRLVSPETLPDELKGSLPSIEEIEAELAGKE